MYALKNVYVGICMVVYFTYMCACMCVYMYIYSSYLDPLTHPRSDTLVTLKVQTWKKIDQELHPDCNVLIV